MENYLVKEVNSSATDTDLFIAKSLPLLFKLLPKRKQQQPSEWNKFVGEHMKQGLAMPEIAKLWKDKANRP